MSDPWAEICRREASVGFSPSDCCQRGESSDQSPIDAFYASLAGILTAADPARDDLGSVLLLGIVSATEQYFRSVLADTIEVCPICRVRASESVLSLESVDYYGSSSLGHGLLEGQSLASSKELEKATLKLTGVQIENSGSVRSAVDQFDKVCHLRHAVVHRLGYLSARNAKCVGVLDGGPSYRVRIDFAAVHAVGSVCQNAVRAYNGFLFRKVVELWLQHGLLIGKWAYDKKRFGALCRLYYSRTDAVGPGEPYRRYTELRPIILKRASLRSGVAARGVSGPQQETTG